MSWGERSCRNFGNCEHSPTMGSCHTGCEHYKKPVKSKSKPKRANNRRKKLHTESRSNKFNNRRKPYEKTR